MLNFRLIYELLIFNWLPRQAHNNSNLTSPRGPDVHGGRRLYDNLGRHDSNWSTKALLRDTHIAHVHIYVLRCFEEVVEKQRNACGWQLADSWHHSSIFSHVIFTLIFIFGYYYWRPLCPLFNFNRTPPLHLILHLSHTLKDFLFYFI